MTDLDPEAQYRHMQKRTDIVERLREATDEIEKLRSKCSQVDRYVALLNDAIADNEPLRDEIERLRDDTQMLWDAVAEKNAEIERLRTLLQELIDIEGPQPGTADWAAKVHVALEVKQ